MRWSRAQQLIAVLWSALFAVAWWSVAWGQNGQPAQQSTSIYAPEAALGTAFTYQGQLELNGALINDVCDFRFGLWDSPSGAGGQVGATLTRSAVPVAQGKFVIDTLDFGANAFGPEARWLEIEVRCPAGGGAYVKLAPRQRLTPAPASLYAASAPWNGLTDVPPGFADGVDNNSTYSAGAGLTLNGSQFNVNFAGSGGDDLAARSDHNHWGQTWMGDDWGLILDGNANYSNSAALVATARGGEGTGVQGLAALPNSSAGMLVPTGVSGISLVPAGGWGNRTYGVYGQAGSDGGYGVFGYGTYTGTAGLADGSSGRGVYGQATGGGGTGVWGDGPNGMYANSTVSNGNGIVATANTGTLAFGVWGISSQGYAGYFSGRVNVTGTLTKGGGAFRIDHPLNPANQYLQHSFVESPDMKNIYDGVVTLDANGEATVTMPDWFDALNRDFRYQLTCIGGYAPVYVAQEISGRQFRIAGGTPGLKVSWQVTGIRQDPWAEDNRIQVELAKPPEEAGTYLYPQGYGMPESLGLTYEREKALEVYDAPQARPVLGQDVWIGDAPASGEVQP